MKNPTEKNILSKWGDIQPQIKLNEEETANTGPLMKT